MMMQDFAVPAARCSAAALRNCRRAGNESPLMPAVANILRRDRCVVESKGAIDFPTAVLKGLLYSTRSIDRRQCDGETCSRRYAWHAGLIHQHTRHFLRGYLFIA